MQVQLLKRNTGPLSNSASGLRELVTPASREHSYYTHCRESLISLGSWAAAGATCGKQGL